VMAVRLGPKDVHIEHSGNRLAASRYLRLTTQGFYRSLAELLAKKAYAKSARPRVQSEHVFAFVLSWV
jgi:hypothetical protein